MRWKNCWKNRTQMLILPNPSNCSNNLWCHEIPLDCNVSMFQPDFLFRIVKEFNDARPTEISYYFRSDVQFPVNSYFTAFSCFSLFVEFWGYNPWEFVKRPKTWAMKKSLRRRGVHFFQTFPQRINRGWVSPIYRKLNEGIHQKKAATQLKYELLHETKIFPDEFDSI